MSACALVTANMSAFYHALFFAVNIYFFIACILSQCGACVYYRTFYPARSAFFRDVFQRPALSVTTVTTVMRFFLLYMRPSYETGTL